MEHTPARATETAHRTAHRRFRADWPTVVSAIVLLAVAPISLACVVPFAWLLAVVLPGEWWHYSIAYYAVIVVALLPGMHWLQILLIARDTRDPTAQELVGLHQAWNNVRRAAHQTGPDRHKLRVTDSAELNATARGTSIVTVTSGALMALSPDELEAVLAHEHGHHVGFHAVTGLTQWWLQRPLCWMMVVADFMARVSAGLHGVASGWTGEASGVWAFIRLALQIALWGAYVVLRVVSYVLVGVLWLVGVLMLWMSRRAEYVADRHAVRLGYGAQLLSAFVTMETYYEQPADSEPWSVRLFSTHPPIEKRKAKVTQAFNLWLRANEHQR